MDGGHPRNPAELPLVTLDHNALVALRGDEPDAPAVRQLLDLNRVGLICVNVTMSTAMEAQQPKEQLEWQDLAARIESLGIRRENIFTSSRSVGFVTPGEPNTMTFSPDAEKMLVRRIYSILFPNRPFMWREYRHNECDKLGLTELQYRAVLELDSVRWITSVPPRNTPALDMLPEGEKENLRQVVERLVKEWFNAHNDAQGFYTHLTLAWYTVHPEYAVFVTSDKNFRKQTKIIALRGLGYRGEILRPDEAVLFLREAFDLPSRSDQHTTQPDETA
jgi:hypothetical protein